jgi:hypothetical protein
MLMTAPPWSKKFPIEPGTWMFRAEFSSVTVFHYIERLPNGELAVVTKDGLEHMDLRSLIGEWKGPLSASDLEKWQ